MTRGGARAPLRIVVGHPAALVQLGFAELVRGFAGAELRAAPTTGEQTVAAVNRHRPDVLVLAADFHEVLVRVRQMPRVLLVSPHQHAGRNAGDARSCAFSSERESFEVLRNTLRQLLACSEPETGAQICARCPLKQSLLPAALPLSAREQQVFDLIATGWTTSRIAVRLGISVKTVETYRCNIKDKLDLPGSRALTEAAVLWRRGIHPPGL